MLVTQSCPTLCYLMNCSPSGPLSLEFLCMNTRVGCHLLLQGIFLTSERTWVSCTEGRFFTSEPPGKTHYYLKEHLKIFMVKADKIYVKYMYTFQYVHWKIKSLTEKSKKHPSKWWNTLYLLFEWLSILNKSILFKLICIYNAILNKFLQHSLKKLTRRF